MSLKSLSLQLFNGGDYLYTAERHATLEQMVREVVEPQKLASKRAVKPNSRYASEEDEDAPQKKVITCNHHFACNALHLSTRVVTVSWGGVILKTWLYTVVLWSGLGRTTPQM